jgi:transposase-like protein
MLANLPKYGQEARSLMEGFSNVLALDRPSVGPTLGHHLRTTNVIESVNAHVQTRLRKIKCYLSSGQRCARVAMPLS